MQDTHSAKITDITGVLLAGGKSRRMGRDKACIEVAGRPLFVKALDFLCQSFKTVIIAGDRSDLASQEIRSIPDIYPGSALGGIYTGLSYVQTDWAFVIPCDMPYPDSRILELLFEQRDGVDAVVPETPDGYEPAFALYHKNCLPTFEKALQQGRRSIYRLYPELNVRFLNWRDLPEGWEKGLMNVNTPDELAEILEDTK